MRTYSSILLVTVGALLAGCDTQSRGFALPPGDADRGRAEFVSLQCNQCHSIAGIDKLSEGGEPEINVALGGQVTRVKTYGDLVTSIINPSHKLSRRRDPTTVDAQGQSRMRNYNEIMTVAQLVDLTAFLQSQYEVWVPDYPYYVHP